MKKLAPSKPYIFFFSLLYLCLVLLMPKASHEWDMSCWKNWSIYIFDHGIQHVYECGTDYLPLYHYILWFFGKIQGSVSNIERNIYTLKSITLFFDFVTGMAIIALLQQKIQNKYKVLTLSLLFLLNAGILYNTLIWGQVDGIMTSVLFLSFYFGYTKSPFTSMVFLLLALNFKLQSIIFVPFIGLLILPDIIQTTFKKILGGISVIVLLQIFILLPFILEGNTPLVWDVVKNSFGKYPQISMNAYNLWFILCNKSTVWKNDNQPFIGAISYKTFGMILFFLTSFLALFPLIKSTLISISKKTPLRFSLENYLLTATLLPLLFFFVNTQMHERYSHPAFAFLITYSILSGRYYLAVLGTVCYFLNLEDVLRYLQLPNYKTVIFTPIFISILYLMLIILLFSALYKRQTATSPVPK